MPNKTRGRFQTRHKKRHQMSLCLFGFITSTNLFINPFYSLDVNKMIQKYDMRSQDEEHVEIESDILHKIHSYNNKTKFNKENYGNENQGSNKNKNKSIYNFIINVSMKTPTPGSFQTVSNDLVFYNHSVNDKIIDSFTQSLKMKNKFITKKQFIRYNPFTKEINEYVPKKHELGYIETNQDEIAKILQNAQEYRIRRVTLLNSAIQGLRLIAIGRFMGYAEEGDGINGIHSFSVQKKENNGPFKYAMVLRGLKGIMCSSNEYQIGDLVKCKITSLKNYLYYLLECNEIDMSVGWE